MPDADDIPNSIDNADPSAAEELLPLVYSELRQLAIARMRDERAGHSLSPTALVHEAYVRLTDREQVARWNNRGHFFAAAAEAMRRILIDHARKLKAAKRGGDLPHIETAPLQLTDAGRAEELIDLDEALRELQQIDVNAARIVNLRFFAGLTNQQAAEQMGISPRKANVLWAYARAWLRRAMENPAT